MRFFISLARKLQFLDRAVPLQWRVPSRFLGQRLVGGLEPEMRLLPELVPPDKIALDVGGNRGTYAYALSKLARAVLTFEPIPDCARMLQAWAEGTNVTVHAVGLGDCEGIFELHVPRVRRDLRTTRASFSRRDGDGIDLRVPMLALDQLQLEDVGFIKIDVEGSEYATLLGGEDTLRRCRPNLLIEIDPERQSSEAFSRTFAWLEARGYAGHYLDGDVLRPCGAHIQSEHPDRANFIFLPMNPH